MMVGRGVLRGHPPGLLTCAATEMWERFSFYGMRALLVFYLTRHFRFTDEESFGIYGAYTALVYMSTIIGGAVADRWLGARRAVLLGGVLLVVGHLGLAVEGPAAIERVAADGARIIERSAVHLDGFLLSLAFIVVGVGFLKTNATALVGALYERDDARRDAGFTTYYMLYNLGGAAAPLVCGWLGERFGWSYGFGAA
ncbi:MAG: MFS transporter, partial [Gemmatimonadaceae bacterium]|nr:MFS transporter [Gemmatimonadaceae bacterium]